MHANYFGSETGLEGKKLQIKRKNNKRRELGQKKGRGEDRKKTEGLINFTAAIPREKQAHLGFFF